MDLDSAYQAALDYIYSFVDFSRTHQENLAPEKFNLDRMRVLMDALGNPDLNYQTIHIAGTKGKGSVSAFCASVLQEAGSKTGLYTSPHLKDFEERIQINREPISRVELVTLVDQIKPHIDKIPWITTFEISTALALWYFSRQNVEIAVIEVGLGGRLDATNVITPLVSVITSHGLLKTACPSLICRKPQRKVWISTLISKRKPSLYCLAKAAYWRWIGGMGIAASWSMSI